MKKRSLILCMVLVLLVSLLSGCTKEETNDGAQEAKNEEMREEVNDLTYGKVTAIGEDSITIEIGTRKEMEKPEVSDASEASEENQETEENQDTEKQPPNQNPEDMFTFDGEEQEISIDENTKITRGGMGAKPEQKPEEQTDSEEETDSEEQADSEKSDETKPEKPEGAMEAEEIELADLAEGDIVSLKIGDDGIAEEISVMTGGNDEENTTAQESE